MAVELNTLPSNNINNIDTNFQRVEVALQDAVSRSGQGPNQFTADVDMNSKNILNINRIDVQEFYMDGQPIASIPAFEAIVEIAPDIIVVADIADEIVSVSSNAFNINTVGNNITNVNAVGTNIDAIIGVNNALPAITTANANSTNINTVASNISSVVTVATNITNVNTVTANIVNVNTVAMNIASVNTAATNIAAIIDAPTQAANAATSATLAQKWAMEAEDVPVLTSPNRYSAFHWAAKAAASAGITMAQWVGAVTGFATKTAPAASDLLGFVQASDNTGRKFTWAQFKNALAVTDKFILDLASAASLVDTDWITFSNALRLGRQDRIPAQSIVPNGVFLAIRPEYSRVTLFFKNLSLSGSALPILRFYDATSTAITTGYQSSCSSMIASAVATTFNTTGAHIGGAVAASAINGKFIIERRPPDIAGLECYHITLEASTTTQRITGHCIWTGAAGQVPTAFRLESTGADSYDGASEVVAVGER